MLRRGMATDQVLAVRWVSKMLKAIPRLESLDGCLECPCSGLCGAAISYSWFVSSQGD